MLPILSAALTVARAMRGLTIPDVARMAGVDVQSVFDAENFLELAEPMAVHLVASALNVDVEKLK